MPTITRARLKSMLGEYVAELNALDTSVDHCVEDLWQVLLPTLVDADRYRWLRDKSDFDVFGYPYAVQLDGTDLDHAIDKGRGA